MANINQILRNLRRKGIENENDLVCPNCGWTIDTDYLYRAISDGNYNLYWEHKITKKNTHGEDVTVSEYRHYPQNSTHVPAYLEIYTWCRSTDDNDEYDCEYNFTIKYHIISQEVI